MHQARPQQLLKRIYSPQKIKFLTDSLTYSMIKASKQVYNLSTRNIKQFVREHREMELKRKQDVVNLKKNNNQNKKYDQNQLMELEFKLTKTDCDPVFVDKCKTEPSDIISIGQRTNKRRGHSKIISGFNAVEVGYNNKTVMNRPKRDTYIEPNAMRHLRQQSSQILPRIGIRKKSKSTFQYLQGKPILREFDLSSKLRVSNLESTPQYLDKSPSSLLGNSSKILSKKNTSIIQNNQTEKIVNITEDKMIRYIKNLHTIINGFYQFGKPLNEDSVNKLLLQRYSVQKISTQSQPDLTTIQVQSKKFTLPYTEFISESEIRKSIHRILNMSAKMAQKVVFQLFDLNKNGYIDEKDMIDLVELSMKIPEIKQDFIRIVRHMHRQESFSISNVQSNSYRENSYRQILKLKDAPARYVSIQASKLSQNNAKYLSLKKPVQKHERSNTFSTSEMTQQLNQRQTLKNDKNTNSCHFNKKQFYFFIQSKKNFFNARKSKEREKFKFCINFQDFTKIFGDQRPLAFYDVIRYLFGVRKDDLCHSEIGEQSQKLRRQNQSKVKTKETTSYEHKNYNIQEIIRDFQRKFTCDIEMSRYEQVLNFGKFSQRQDQPSLKEKEKQKDSIQQ